MTEQIIDKTSKNGTASVVDNRKKGKRADLDMSGWEFDTSEWVTMANILDWQDASTNGKIGVMTTLMAETITAWPLPGEPSEIESYRNLTPKQWADAVGHMSSTVGRFLLTLLDED